MDNIEKIKIIGQKFRLSKEKILNFLNRCRDNE